MTPVCKLTGKPKNSKNGIRIQAKIHASLRSARELEKTQKRSANECEIAELAALARWMSVAMVAMCGAFVALAATSQGDAGLYCACVLIAGPLAVWLQHIGITCGRAAVDQTSAKALAAVMNETPSQRFPRLRESVDWKKKTSRLPQGPEWRRKIQRL